MLAIFVGVSRSIGLAALVAIVSVRIAVQPVIVGRPALVVFAPWVSGGQSIARATVGAKLLARGVAPFAVTVIPERPDYATIIVERGALLVSFFPSQVGCFSREGAQRGAKSS